MAFWDDVLARLAKDPDWQDTLERSLWSNAYMNSAQMQRYYEGEFVALKGVLEELGLTKQ